MYGKLYLLAVLFLFIPIVYSLTISEVMSNPFGSDTGREWTEIYNNDSNAYNITGWKLNTGGTDHTLNAPPTNGGRGAMVIAPSEYFIIAQDGAYFVSNFTFNGTVIDSSWSDLSNSANETMWLKNSSVVFHNITISPIVADGNSTCLINNSFIECTPSPGAANILLQPNATSNATNTTSCNLSIVVNTNKAVFGIEVVDYKITISNSPCSMTNVTVYSSVEDLFGTVIKSFSFTQELSCSYTSERQWTPDEITRSEAYQITANITQQSCNNTYAGDNYASKIIVVKGSAVKNEPYIKIEKLNIGSDNEIAYGEAGEIQITAYRGNTSMNAVDVYVHDAGTKLSFVSNFNLNTKFGNYSINVPFQMKPNCDNAFPNGTFTLVASGLGVSDSASIKVNGVSSDVCKTATRTISTQSASSGDSSAATSEPKISVVKYDYIVPAGGDMITIVNITTQIRKNFSVYAYVFSGNEPVSLGYADGRWLGAYDANKIQFYMDPGSKIIELSNRVENKTAPGEYNLRVRIKHDDLTKDITKKMWVEKSEIPNNATPEQNNSKSSIADLEIPPAPNHTQATTMAAADNDSKNKFFIPHFNTILELVSIFFGR